MSFIWNELIIAPMINALLLFYQFLGNNFVLAIAVFTVLIRLITLPLNLRQQRSSMKMQEMQPQIQAIQKKYRDNPQKMQEEFQKIGYNPADTLTGCLPLLIQMPILFGLYRGILIMLGSTPQAVFELTQRAYSFINLSEILPISSKFLWLDLGKPDQFFILPVLVVFTMFAQQKLLSPATNKSKNKGNQKDDNPAAAMTQSMQYTMPIMFGIFSLQFQAGLSIYFVLSNLIGIGQGYYVRRLMASDGTSKSFSSNGSDMISQPEMNSKEEKILTQPDSGQKAAYKPKRPTSKRKRRSAKR